MSERVLAWFSCGAASAVAAKVALEKYGQRCQVLYCDTLYSEHPDNKRFFEDVQRWLGVEIKVLRSKKYRSIDGVFGQERYMSGVAGAKCTVEMKKMPRIDYQLPTDLHVFGYTSDEATRAERFEKNNPDLAVEWVLVEEGIDKAECLKRVAGAGIALPEMYALGFDHNNCLGCVKSASPGYWNKIRRLFPEVFERRVRQSRLLGVKLAVVTRNKKRVRIFLDEIPPDDTTPDDDIDCGPVCQTPSNVFEQLGFNLDDTEAA